MEDSKLDSVYLRSLEPEDLERVHAWHNDPAMYESLMGTFHYVSRPTVENWLRSKCVFSDREINLAICLKSNSQHIGNIYLRDIDHVSRHGLAHIFIGESQERGKRYGQQATRMLVEYAFNELALHRVYTYVLEDNIASIRMFEKCGFAVEGKMRNHVYKRGVYRDVVILGVCAGDVG